MRKSIDIALAFEPHLILLTGDYCGGPFFGRAWRAQLRRLWAPLGVFGVLGNHDHGDSKAPFVKSLDQQALRDSGVTLLINEVATVEYRGATLQIAGVDDSGEGRDDLPAVLAQLDRRPAVLRLLLSHHVEVGLGAAAGDLQLTLGGDTHGGQICIPLPGGPVPLSDLEARFVAGEYVDGGRTLFVTRGVGTSLLPFRAFCRPEAVCFTVDAGTEQTPAG